MSVKICQPSGCGMRAGYNNVLETRLNNGYYQDTNFFPKELS